MYPNQGVIVRANPDGSDFEVFAADLRNIHEFVFDNYGNLISVDNDGDHAGETERLVYVVNGFDSGWRTNWQFGKYTDADNNRYKVWMDEQLFKPRFDGQAAYITPPVASYHSGPAGMIYNPGTALNDAWRNHFFVAEFTGSPARSRIFAFRIAPGYGTVALTLRDGQTLRGRLHAETDTHLVVATEEDEPTNVAKETITERQDAPSGMPPMGAVLSRREIRDVIAFLTTLQ